MCGSRSRRGRESSVGGATASQACAPMCGGHVKIHKLTTNSCCLLSMMRVQEPFRFQRDPFTIALLSGTLGMSQRGSMTQDRRTSVVGLVMRRWQGLPCAGAAESCSEIDVHSTSYIEKCYKYCLYSPPCTSDTTALYLQSISNKHVPGI